MKSFAEILTESRTSPQQIKNYAKSWTTQSTGEDYIVLVKSIAEGILDGLKDNAKAYKDDEMEQQTIKEYTDVLNELIDKVEELG